MRIGEYPPEYNKAIHGPYDPARYYGKPDTPFTQVKLGELFAWFGRRNKSPQAATQAVSRAFWRWQHKYVFPVRAGIASYFQLTMGLVVIFYCLNYKRIKTHRNYKYH
ncbi:hypothetical protein KPH14_010258 [Odynerus spinipes]|uniref:ATP synthase subunit f, mitochondrial n=1 Tax=Odynerus spinipes TaxID=1348599 RepID=A0AAD9VSZ4_9HYME|nr:hypothetical protein KPH14_010258 [Odynerus spinipes]